MKNPWLSLWMSGANAWGGAARGLMAAEASRAQTSMMSEAARRQTAMVEEAARRWTAIWFPHSPQAKSPPRRRKRRSG